MGAELAGMAPVDDMSILTPQTNLAEVAGVVGTTLLYVLTKTAKGAPSQIEKLLTGFGIEGAENVQEQLNQVGGSLFYGLTKMVARAPGQEGSILQLEKLMESLGLDGAEEAGKLGHEAVMELSKVLKTVLDKMENGDIQGLEDNLDDILETGLFAVTCFQPFIILFMFFIKGIIMKGAITMAERGILEQEEAIHRGRTLCARMWRLYSKVYHGQEWEGLENIPKEGGALIIYYHGPLQVDYFALIGETWLQYGRAISSIVDRSLMAIPYMDIIREQFNMFPGTRESCVELLRSGHLLGIAPGGAYEALFADNNYPLLWGSRQGFAAVAIAADVPIIPIFTENIRESTLNMAGRMKSSKTKNYFETLYRATKLPVSPSYGLFPVKLKTHIGTPIYPKKDMTPEQMVTLTTYAIEQMISKYQQLPGSLPRALKERVNYEAAKLGLDLSPTDDDDDDEEEDEESFVDYVRDWFGRMPKE